MGKFDDQVVEEIKYLMQDLEGHKWAFEILEEIYQLVGIDPIIEYLDDKDYIVAPDIETVVDMFPDQLYMPRG